MKILLLSVLLITQNLVVRSSEETTNFREQNNKIEHEFESSITAKGLELKLQNQVINYSIFDCCRYFRYHQPKE